MDWKKNHIPIWLATTAILICFWVSCSPLLTEDEYNSVKNGNWQSTTTTTATTIQASPTQYVYKFPFDDVISDVVADPHLPIIYAINRTEKKLLSINCATKEIKEIAFALTPEKMVFANDTLYITLLKAEHSYYWWANEQYGAVAIVDCGDFSVSRQYDIDLDPYGIALDNDGNIIVSSGSGQWSAMNRYTLEGDILQVTAHCSCIWQGSPIQYNSALNVIYSVENGRNTSYRINDDNTVSCHLGSTPYGTTNYGRFTISPNEDCVFNSSGNIYYCSRDTAVDLEYKGKLDTAFNDIAFDMNDDRMYIGYKDAIYRYSYSGLSKSDTRKIDASIMRMYLREDKLMCLTSFFHNYYIQVFDAF